LGLNGLYEPRGGGGRKRRKRSRNSRRKRGRKRMMMLTMMIKREVMGGTCNTNGRHKNTQEAYILLVGRKRRG
jgi:hypothetical protein